MKQEAEKSRNNNALALSEVIAEESIQKFNSIQSKIALIEQAEGNRELTQMAVAAVKANVIAELQKALTPEFVTNIKKTLENNRLGFKTDNKEGYPLETIKTCLIESAIQGFYWHGNEFNIIAGNAYFTKEGLTNKMRRGEEYTDVKLSFGIPEMQVQNQRALISVKATWKYHGKEDSIEETIPVKLLIKNGINYTTDDAIIGKANRKIRARIIEQSTGNPIPEGDAEEVNKEINANKVNDMQSTEYQEVKEKISDTINAYQTKQNDQAFNEAIEKENPKYWLSKVSSYQGNLKEFATWKKENKNNLEQFSGKDDADIKEAVKAKENELLKIGK
jgi:hypothetical protein